MKEKWDKNIDDLKVRDLVSHWFEVEKIFNVEDPTLLLDNIIDGCIEIHWLIPVELINIIRDSVNSHTIEMVVHSILHFDIEGHVIMSPYQFMPLHHQNVSPKDFSYKPRSPVFSTRACKFINNDYVFN